MRRLHFGCLALAVLWCTPSLAQPANRITNFLRTALAQRSGEIAAAAAKMPADRYDFKAPPDEVTFGYLALHIADGNFLFCSSIGGTEAPNLPQLSESDPKDNIIERMNSSFEFCKKAVAKLDDSKMAEILIIGDAKMSRAMAILTLTGSWVTHYEIQVRYLQLNGYLQSSG